MKNKNLALLTLRLILVIIFLYHGLPKALDWELAMGKFESMGFPPFLGPLIGMLEVIGSIFLLSGYRNKETNFLLGSIILVAILGVQVPSAFNNWKLLTAGLERDLLILIIHYALFVFGPGEYKISTFILIQKVKKTLNYRVFFSKV